MLRSAVSLVLLALCAMPPAARAQSFAVTTLVDSNHTRPDQNTPWYVFGPPVLDAGTAVFMTKNAQVFATLDGIWAIDTTSLVPLKLAGLATPVPGGNGSFSGFGLFYASDNPLPTAGGGRVVFYGADQSGTHGLYTVKETGGAIHKIVTTATLAPDDGTAFAYFAQARTNGHDVVFYGRTQGGRSGIFEAQVDGAGLHTVIDNTVNLDARGYGGGTAYYGGYTGPVIGARTMDFYATGIGDPSQYPNEIFQAAGAGYVGRADNLTPLQGDPAGVGHTQITGYSAAVEGSELAMAAFDGPYAGLFVVHGAATRAASRLVSTRTIAPGTAGDFTMFYGFAYDTSGLGFTANDPADGQSVWFKPPGGQPVLVAPGAGYYFPTLADHSVSGGNLVFFAGSIFSNAIYVARPAAGGAG